MRFGIQALSYRSEPRRGGDRGVLPHPLRENGTEASGRHDEWRKHCNVLVHIPPDGGFQQTVKNPGGSGQPYRVFDSIEHLKAYLRGGRGFPDVVTDIESSAGDECKHRAGQRYEQILELSDEAFQRMRRLDFMDG